MFIVLGSFSFEHTLKLFSLIVITVQVCRRFLWLFTSLKIAANFAPCYNIVESFLKWIQWLIDSDFESWSYNILEIKTIGLGSTIGDYFSKISTIARLGAVHKLYHCKIGNFCPPLLLLVVCLLSKMDNCFCWMYGLVWLCCNRNSPLNFKILIRCSGVKIWFKAGISMKYSSN